jgi:hypothetical protein
MLIPIDINDPLATGELIEMHFRTVGGAWLTGAQVALIESRVAGDPHFDILSWSIPSAGRLIFRIRVGTPNPVLVTAAVISAAILISGVGIWLAFDGVYKIAEAPAELIKGPVGTALGIAVAAIIGALAIKAVLK